VSQTFALLIDAYRELNARRMFWISLTSPLWSSSASPWSA
jgi:hypothetical protein